MCYALLSIGNAAYTSNSLLIRVNGSDSLEERRRLVIEAAEYMENALKNAKGCCQVATIALAQLVVIHKRYESLSDDELMATVFPVQQ
jgi:hypothetical protein